MERCDKPSHCRIDISGALSWVRVGECQGARCDAGDARDSRDKMVLGFRENAAARTQVSESGWFWSDLGCCQGTRCTNGFDRGGFGRFYLD
jgi:hypothetical protein